MKKRLAEIRRNSEESIDFADLYEELDALMERRLSEGIAEQQLNNSVVEVESAVEWQANATGDEINMGDQDDMPIYLCEELEALGKE
jgi:hypothetical protein